MWTGSRASDGRAGRFADRYANCLDRLADPRPHQRIGALHTFEALGDEYPAHTQAVVDVLCAYLRNPATADDLAVRVTAQRLIAAHLRPGPRFWPGIRLDLSGVAITDLDLSDCQLAGLNLDGSVLHGSTRVRGAVVDGRATLRRTTFTDHAWFERSVFRDIAWFDGATFHADAWFGSVVFGSSVTFAAATFAGHAWFSRCEVGGRAEFSDAVFRRSAGFRGAVFRGGAGLTGTTFLGPARVSRSGERWNLMAPGWGAVVDPDNEAVGQLLWLGSAALLDATPS
jgi:uncharacterized protein YjbI with pentapeptide repeats